MNKTPARPFHAATAAAVALLSLSLGACGDSAASKAPEADSGSIRLLDAAAVADGAVVTTPDAAVPGPDAAVAPTPDADLPVLDAAVVPDSDAAFHPDPDAAAPPDRDAATPPPADMGHGGPRVHPVGYDSSRVHGPDLKQGISDCRTCHGAQLQGGRGPSCDTCHDAGWRTNCTFCHGGTDTESGAPPRDLQGSDDRAVQRFMPHTEHTTERNHAAWDCNQCHVKPVDVLTPGHIFDDRTPGAAEVDFSGGLSPGATWDGNGNCGNVYCHGNGVNPGNYNHAAARPNCDGCHSWIALGGRHLAHFGRLIGCVSCHNGTTDAAQMTADPVLHVNGTVDVIFETPDIAFNAGTCNGNCHGEQHNNRSW